MNTHDYHLEELSIANDIVDPRRVMPLINEGDRQILDVGCGAGQTLVGSNLAQGVLAVGVDVDHSALSFGKRLGDIVQFVNSRGEALPFRNKCFDLVICRVSLPYMHIYIALAEMYRVLKFGGRLWVVMHPLSNTLKELTSNIVRFEVKAALYRLAVLTNGLTFHSFDRPVLRRLGCYESWQTNRGVRRALTKVGFERIQISRGRHFVVTAMKGR